MKRFALAMIAASTLLIAGCGSDGDDDATTPSSSTAAPEPSTPPATSAAPTPTSAPDTQTPEPAPTNTAESGPKNQSDTSDDSTISSSLIIEGEVCYDFEVDMESDGLTCTVTDDDGTSRWVP